MVSLCEGLNEMQCQLKQQHNRMAALCDQTHALQLKHSDQAMKKGWSQLEQQNKFWNLASQFAELKLDLDHSLQLYISRLQRGIIPDESIHNLYCRHSRHIWNIALVLIAFKLTVNTEKLGMV